MNRWFLNSTHGYMLRCDLGDGYDCVVTAPCTESREVEEDKAMWAWHKFRLRVNGGSGAVCADSLRAQDHNPAFLSIEEGAVPEHIREEFLAYVPVEA